MKSPLVISLLRSRTRFVEAKTMIVQRLDMTVCRRRPPEHSAAVISGGRFLTRGGLLGQVHCATRKSHL